MNEFLLTTLENPPGYRIAEIKGIVSANAVRARHLGRDITATFRNILGGEIKEYTRLLAEAREQALERLISKARGMGANAVVGVRMSTASIMSGAAEVLVYGTAVVVEREA